LKGPGEGCEEKEEKQFRSPDLVQERPGKARTIKVMALMRRTNKGTKAGPEVIMVEEPRRGGGRSDRLDLGGKLLGHSKLQLLYGRC